MLGFLAGLADPNQVEEKMVMNHKEGLQNTPKLPTSYFPPRILVDKKHITINLKFNTCTCRHINRTVTIIYYPKPSPKPKPNLTIKIVLNLVLEILILILELQFAQKDGRLRL